MIGVIAGGVEETLIREFFELFKTPWEFYREHQSYDVVLCTGRMPAQISAKLILAYTGVGTKLDEELEVEIQSRRDGAQLSLWGATLPIYGGIVTFRRRDVCGLTDKESGGAAALMARRGEMTSVRIGYDLFAEIRMLLTKGQPIENAGIPTLELHIAFLREIITGCGIPLVEIPPLPDEYDFIGCLTHDVDFGSILGHKFDATMFGFLYRATLGSALDFARGRVRIGKLATNWMAAAKLPLVFLGFAKDFWYEFDDYLDLENGRPSTFFFIPFPNQPGRPFEGAAPRARACRYDVSYLAPKISKLQAAGCEISLHGIDAWIESSSGRAEAQHITRISGTQSHGVRMHWLYFDEKSASRLDDADFCYDSTVGYNETVGYRAGTVQVFKPLTASRLLELPMNVMDTAMFYPKRMNLSASEAWKMVEPLLDNATQYGGVLTVNWHDRSIAPERLWGDSYARLIAEMTEKRAWFATAGQAVSWFQKRRSAVFESAGTEEGSIVVRVKAETDVHLPGLRLRCHTPQKLQNPFLAPEQRGQNYIDRALTGTLDFKFSR